MYQPALLNQKEEPINATIHEALPPARRAVIDQAHLAHLMVMALDGCSIHHRINSCGVAYDATVDRWRVYRSARFLTTPKKEKTGVEPVSIDN